MVKFLSAFGYISVGAVLGIAGLAFYAIYVVPYGGSDSLIPVDVLIGMIVLALVVAIFGIVRMAAKLGRAARLFMSEGRMK